MSLAATLMNISLTKMEQKKFILETTNKTEGSSHERGEAMETRGRYVNLVSPGILASILACPQKVLNEIALKHKVPVIMDKGNPTRIIRYDLQYFRDLLKAMKEENIEANRRWLQELDLDSDKPIEVTFPWGKTFRYRQE